MSVVIRPALYAQSVPSGRVHRVERSVLNGARHLTYCGFKPRHGWFAWSETEPPITAAQRRCTRCYERAVRTGREQG